MYSVRLSATALAAVTVILCATQPARAALGSRDFTGWSWVDSKGAGSPHVISRYVTVPVRTATGDGTINHPTLPAQLWNYTTSAPQVPLETWTLTATSATTFTVSGSVTGALTDATVGSAYTTPAGMNFTITAGGTAFVAGDKFVFTVVDHYDVSTIPGAVAYTIPSTGALPLPPAPFDLYAENVQTSGGVVVAYDAGYVALTTGNDPHFLSDYYPRITPNAALPYKRITHDSAAHVFPFWDELTSKATSKVWVATIGRAASRAYVIEFHDFANKNDLTASYTFQIVFFEGVQGVRFHYLSMQNGTGTFANGSGATIGLQGRLSESYTASTYSVNTASVADGLTIEFGLDGDGDRLPEHIELAYGTSDGTRTSDGGSPALSDSAQLVAGIDPTSAGDNATRSTDTDGDGILDAEEVIFGTNPASNDTDADAVHDNVEISTGTDPTVADTDGDGRADGVEDANVNGSVDTGETNPREWDTDGDGVGDSLEMAQGTDPTASNSSRLSAEINLGNTNAAAVQSVLDSKGNLHVVSNKQGGNNTTPDDLYVALVTPNGGVYATSVATTVITSHVGFDDKWASIVTVPGDAGSTVDRTFVLNGTANGYTFLTEIDFSAAARDGSASTSATIVKSTRMLSIGVFSDHPHMIYAGGKLHIVFQGEEALGSQKLARNQIARGAYYVQLDLAGNITAGPTLVYQKPQPAHHHLNPRLAVDGSGNVHIAMRGGDCRKSQGPSNCDLYYTKLTGAGAVLVPTTKLVLEGSGGLHRNPEVLVSPNGLVNLIYTTNAPNVTGNNAGGYSVGNSVRLYSFATTNNVVTTVIDQKELFSSVPDAQFGLPSARRTPTYRTPAVAMDAGGNIHVFVQEDNMISQGLYAAFAPNGDRKLGPIHVDNVDDWQLQSVQLASPTSVAFAYHQSGGNVNFRQLDITGSGLDLTGGSLVALPGVAELTITAVNPATIDVGEKPLVTVTGDGFVAGTTITIAGLPVTSVSSFDANNLVGKLDATSLAAGDYDVVVQNPNGAMATLAGGFHVSAGPTEPDPPPAAEDDGCCAVGGANPIGSIFLAALVVLGLGRRRRRGTHALLAMLAFTGALAAPRAAHAALGTRDLNGVSWVDSKGATGPRVIARYATVPARTATGDGTINYPSLPAVLWSFTTNAPTIPLESWTLTATSATTFTVSGSVTGAQADATVGASYTTTTGINFTITAGGTAFVAGDKFTFSIVDHLDASTLPGATSYTIPSYGYLTLAPLGFSVALATSNGACAPTVYEAGYVTAPRTTQPSFLQEYFAPVRANTALPSHLQSNPNAAVLMPFWDDLVQKASSKIWYATVGRAGTRIAIIQYDDFAHRNDPTASYTFQVVLFENSLRARYHYIKLLNGSGTFADGSSATVGAQRRLATRFTAASYSTNQTALQDGLVIELGSDPDGDRLPDGIEQQYGTNPSSKTTDAGTPSISDSAQLVAGLDPTSGGDNATATTDTDADTILDIEEAILGTNPALKDTDGDGLEDLVEITSGTNPLVADTDGDGLSDGQEDTDKDGIVDATETSATNRDTDDDGVNDGLEIAQATDPLLATSGRMSPAITIAALNGMYSTDSAVDSKGNLHVVGVRRASSGNQNTPDNMYVALMSPSGATYAMSVAGTLIDSHAGMDDRFASIVTTPGTGTVDRTLILNNSRNGYALLTEIDFNAATRDGTASAATTIVKSTRMINIGVAVDHPVMKLAGGKLHVVFQGQELLGAAQFAHNQITRGSYYMQLDLNGDVVVAPTLLFQKGQPAHHHSYPRLAVDAAGNIHVVVRGGSCRWDAGPADCAIYYTKLANDGTPLIPTTKLQLEGQGGIHRWPEIAVSPNGVVNIIYTTSAPIISGCCFGGYSLGNAVRLYSFATVNRQITTVLPEKELFSWTPDLSQGLLGVLRVPAYRTPSVVLDAGGNLHIFVDEDNNARNGFYAAFAPDGTRKVGPYEVQNVDDWSAQSLQLTGNTVLFAYHNSSEQLMFRNLDITGNGLDLTGNSQLPLPTPEAVSVTGIDPDTVPVGTGTITVTIHGLGFVSGATASIGGMPVAKAATFDAGDIIATFDASGLAEGAYDITVQNPDGAMSTLAGGFYVGERPGTEPTPTPTEDDGCCRVGGGQPSALFLAGLVAIVLGRRRRRR